LTRFSLAEKLERRLLEMGMNPVRRMNPTSDMEKEFLWSGQLQTTGLSIRPEKPNFTGTSTVPSSSTPRHPSPT
jgi:hypothetical protein